MSHSSPTPGPQAALAEPPLGHLYEVGGRRLMLHRTGTGGPAVVFLPGAGQVGLDYLNIHDRAAELTTSVIYDRAGTGWSQGAQLPRTAAEVTDELRDLLRAAGVPAPYLLVGHSLGGAYARHFAQRFPDETADGGAGPPAGAWAPDGFWDTSPLRPDRKSSTQDRRPR
nr:hypothetical protein StreXyl84_00070 [Streptomyces sp. Xyl84]